MKVLLIEDNEELARNIAEYLTREGCVCARAENCSAAMEKLAAFRYDCLILDLMLPDGSGLEVLRQLKSSKTTCGVLILSAKNALDDKVGGLEMGADDYLTKPFHLPELYARLRAIYRRKFLDGDEEISFREFRINTRTMEAHVAEQLLELTRKEYALLLYFLTNKNRVLTRQSIAEHLWGDYVDDLLNFDFVYQHIKNLRRKIEQAGGADYIDTVYGLGYRFNTRHA